MTTSERWIQTLSGDKFFFLEPQSSSLDLTDMATALSRIRRFGGHGITTFSVASHCMLVASMVDDDFKLEALLHDAPEAYLGDVVNPLKQLIKREYGPIEKSTTLALTHRYCKEPISDWPEQVKRADLIALGLEASILFPNVDVYSEWTSPIRDSQFGIDHAQKFFGKTDQMVARQWLDAVEFYLQSILKA